MKILRATDNDFPATWDFLLSRNETNFPLHSNLNQTYYRTYFSEIEFDDHSLIVSNEAGPIAGLRICLSTSGGNVDQITAFGMPTFYIESSTAGARAKHKAFATVKSETDKIISQQSKWEWRHYEVLPRGKLSRFGRHLLNKGALAVPRWTQLIDLTQDQAKIFSEISKSFRSCVNWGRKNMDINVIDAEQVNENHLKQFRDLHVKASGRVTRSASSWKCQLDLVRNREAFIVFGRIEGELISAALFLHSKDYCYYGVSASRRELFDRPISHCLLWQAILHAQELKCVSFDFAGQNFPSESPTPSEKQMQISKFKRGFGGSTMMQLDITLNSTTIVSG